MPFEAQREKILFLCKHLHSKDYLAAADGNISYRIDHQRILITPAGRHKLLIGAADLATIDPTGHGIAGTPSTEALLHCAVYEASGHARWVIHAHPPHTIAWTLAFPEAKHIDFSMLPEVQLGVGTIPVVPYLIPGSRELAQAVAGFIRQHRVVIMSRHGLLAWGETHEEALNGIERTEHAFKILLAAMNTAAEPLQPLEDSLSREIKKIRERRGTRSL